VYALLTHAMSFDLTCKGQLSSRLEPVQDGRFRRHIWSMVVIYIYICAWFFQQTRNVGCTTPACTNDPPLTLLGSHEPSIFVGFLSHRFNVSLVFEHERLYLLILSLLFASRCVSCVKGIYEITITEY
jgi:hypothetical protein